MDVNRKKTFRSRLIASQLVALISLCLWFGWCGDVLAKSLTAKLAFEGKVQYSITRVVKNVYDGEMQELLVHDSQNVKAGDVLGRYALSEYVRGRLQQKIATTVLQQKEMALDEARTKLRGLKRDQASFITMYDEGMTSKAAVDASTDMVDVWLGQISFFEQDVKHEKRRLERERVKISQELGGTPIRSGQIPKMVDIVSPIDGTVVWVIDEKNWELKPNTVCFKVADTAKLVLEAKVFVEDYPKLAEGMVATVTAKGQPEKKFRAVLSKLPLTPIDKGFAALSYYLVEFEMDNPDNIFREGYRMMIDLNPQTVKDKTKNLTP